MSRPVSFVLLFFFAWSVHGSNLFQNVGRTATPAEIAAWDIDVRPDFKGLPVGSGSVKKGEEVWEAKCGSCHGPFGDSNAVFPPIAGGVTAQDLQTGRAAALTRPGEQRTTLMKLSRVSTLWDYINRAMPWNAPKTLSVEEVYAVSAYILSLGNIVPDDFVLSERNIAEVQARLPNRDGMSREHGLWETRGRPDVNSAACMKDCPVSGKVLSRLPEHARAAHGNLADQNRAIGPVRGVVTLGSAPQQNAAPAAQRLAERAGCLACHGAATRLVGPALAEIAARYRTDSGAQSRLVAKVQAGRQGEWGSVPMPPQGLPEEELRTLVSWILQYDDAKETR
jgi:S-disulfanyl-L-cysteine oxidoreductase SoxD